MDSTADESRIRSKMALLVLDMIHEEEE